MFCLGPSLVAGAVIPAQGWDSSVLLKKVLFSAAKGNICIASYFSREKNSLQIKLLLNDEGWEQYKLLTPSLGELHSKIWKKKTISMRFLIKIVWRGFSSASLRHIFPGIFQPSITDLYAQIIYVLHEKKTSATSSMLMSFSASWPPEPGIKFAPRRFSCPMASLWDLHLLHSGCDMSHSLRLSGKHLACGCNKSLVDSKEMSRRMMWESTSCMAWTQVHMLPRCSLGQRAQPALLPAFAKNSIVSPALKREF